MTNAHVVAMASFITVQRDGDARAVPAFVEFAAHDSDLAILRVKDKNYFNDVVPLTFGTVPKLHSPVAAIGYPLGGDQLSITEGVVSRFGVRPYVHTNVHEHLLIQVSSPINPGNSGGPVFQGRQVIGVAFQTFLRAQSTGYIIPVPVVQRFLQDIQDGVYDGHPYLGIATEPWYTGNEAFRKFSGLSDDESGVAVTGVNSLGNASGYLEVGDVLLKIAGQTIGSDGRLVFEGERVEFQALFDLRQKNDRVRFELIRSGKRMEVSVNVAPPKPLRVRGHLYNKHPPYIVFAGLVFTILSEDYLSLWGREWYYHAPIFLRYLQQFSEFHPAYQNHRAFVVLSEKLPHSLMSTLDIPVGESVLSKVNGRDIYDLKDLSEALLHTPNDMIVFELMNEGRFVLPKIPALRAHDEIRKRYRLNDDVWLDETRIDGAISWQ